MTTKSESLKPGLLYSEGKQMEIDLFADEGESLDDTTTMRG